MYQSHISYISYIPGRNLEAGADAKAMEAMLLTGACLTWLTQSSLL